jgi:hypothetical protein
LSSSDLVVTDVVDVAVVAAAAVVVVVVNPWPIS